MALIKRVFTGLRTRGFVFDNILERRWRWLSGFALIFECEGLSSTKDGTQMALIKQIFTDFWNAVGLSLTKGWNADGADLADLHW